MVNPSASDFRRRPAGGRWKWHLVAVCAWGESRLRHPCCASFPTSRLGGGGQCLLLQEHWPYRYHSKLRIHSIFWNYYDRCYHEGV